MLRGPSMRQLGIYPNRGESAQPLSIGWLALGFVAAVGLLMLGISAYAVLEIDHLTHQQRIQEQVAAENEARTGCERLLREIQTTARQLAMWDETKQQLFAPKYYPLWRDNRVKDAGMVPASVAGIALYDKAGRVLSEASGDTGMPIYLPDTSPFLLHTYRAGQHYLHYYTLVYADPGNNTVLGYLGLRYNLGTELNRVHSYRHADMATLRVALPDYAIVTAQEILSALRVDAKSSQEFSLVQQAVKSALWRMLALTLCSLLLALFLLHRLVIRPLHKLSAQIDHVRDYGPLATSEPGVQQLPILELEKLRYSFREYQARLTDLHRNLEQTSRDFYRQSRHDALTGAYNRRAFDEDWRHVGQTPDTFPLTLLLFDCDHFKAINDTYGHQVGDAVLKGIADAVQAAMRATDRLYRLGGDEFATLLCNIEPQQALRLAEICLAKIQAHPFHTYGVNEPVNISIGLACAVQPITLYDIQKRADLAMYTAKRPGSSKVVCYTPEMGEIATLVSNRTIHAVTQAIVRPELIELHYQPVFRLPERCPEYVEALARIRMENGEIITPDAIFPIITARGLDAEFDLAVIQALEIALRQQTLPPQQGISFNLSAQGIVNLQVIESTLALAHQYPEHKLIAEITESALITRIEKASAHIRMLHDAGCLVALDDFGSGYSSLRYLAVMPVDLVKFDISMVRMIAEEGNPRQQKILEGIIRMIIEAGYDLIAEGIESEAMLNRVIELKFSHAQGYHCGRPQQHPNS